MRGKKPNRYMKGGFRLRSDGSPVVNTRLTRARFLRGAAAGVAGAAIGASGVAHATPGTIIVPDDYTSIQAAVNDAVDGDTILVKYGTYNEMVEIVDKSVTILGDPSGNKPIIQHGGDVIDIYGNLTGKTVSLNNLTIISGGSRAVRIHDVSGVIVTVDDCILTGGWSGLFIERCDLDVDLRNSDLTGTFGAFSAFAFWGDIEGNVHAENNTFKSIGYNPWGYSMGIYLSSDSTNFSATFVHNKIKMTSPAQGIGNYPLVCGSNHFSGLRVYNVTFDDLEIDCKNPAGGILYTDAENCSFNNIWLTRPTTADVGIEMPPWAFTNTTNNCIFSGIDFSKLHATTAQVYMDEGVHNNYFGPNEQGIPNSFGNIIGQAEAGLVCEGDNNTFEENKWMVNYPDWEEGYTNKGLWWFTAESSGNQVINPWVRGGVKWHKHWRDDGANSHTPA